MEHIHDAERRFTPWKPHLRRATSVAAWKHMTQHGNNDICRRGGRDMAGQERAEAVDWAAEPARAPEGDTPAIEVEGLVKRYGSLTAVGGITFRVRQGESFGLLGPNGAGKTT